MQQRSLFRLRVAVALAAVLPVALFGAAAALTRQAAAEKARWGLESLARAGEADAARIFDTDEIVLQQLSRMLRGEDDAAIRSRAADLRRLLSTLRFRLPHLGAIAIRGAGGELLVASGEAPAPSQPLVASAPRAGGGSIELAVRPSALVERYRRLAEGSPGVDLALSDASGRVLARWPQAGGTGGAYRASRALARYPYRVSARQDTDAVFAAWRRQVALLGGVTAPIAAALVAAAVFALRRTRSEMEASERLREESESRRRAEEALRHAQRLEALGQLTGGLAHDFNNLLMVVSANVQVLAARVPQAARSAQLQAILRTVETGSALIGRLLAFSRRRPLRSEAIELERALPPMLDLLSTTCGKGVEISLHVAPGTPAVEVDRAALETALINLAANARDAMDRSGRLELLARPVRPHEGPAGGAAISVSDTGCGIAAADRERVFEPFFTTKPPGSGSGLGLSQVYGFCRQAGGSVRLESVPGTGTCVTLLLPAAQREPEARPERSRRSPALAAARVLLVEDNPELARALESLLAGRGCRVTAAASAEEAERRVVAGERYDLVLSDVVMPGRLDGVELALGLRELRPRLPVVLMTGYAEGVERAAAAGIEVLNKPFSSEELAAALARQAARAGTSL